MRYFFLLLLPLLIGGSSLRAQSPPAVQWQTRLLAHSNYNNCLAITYTRHHRLACVGQERRPASLVFASALWLLSAQGDSLRTTTYSYPVPNYPVSGAMFDYDLEAVAELANGDLLLAGTFTRYTSATASTHDLALLRTDSLGALRWVHTYPGADAIQARALQPLPDGGALFVSLVQHPLGTPNTPVSVPTVMRVDSAGTEMWRRTYGQPYFRFDTITPLSDGSYALAGTANTGPPQWQGQGWLLRLDLNGNVLRTLGLLPDVVLYGLSEMPDEGLALVGVTTRTQEGLLAVVDSLDRLQWQRGVPRLRNGTYSCVLAFVRPLQQPGQLLVAGVRPMPLVNSNITDDYLSLWQAPVAGAPAAPVWEQQRNIGYTTGNQLTNRIVPTQAGRLCVSGNYRPNPGPWGVLATQLTNIPALYEPPLCRTPPEAHLGLVPDAGGLNFTVVDLSLAGPRYAQLVRWRWDWGDGSPVVEGPRPLGHSYTARVPGTAVRLTVTNNLGCVSTEVEYPFGLLPTRPAQLQAALTLHPNPATGVTVTVTLPGLAPQGPVAGEVVNSLGQVVQRLSLPVAALAGGASVEVGGLAAGVYALRLHPQEGAVTARLIKH